MKKILLVSLLAVALSSCTNPLAQNTTPNTSVEVKPNYDLNTFAGLYQRAIDTKTSAVEKFYKDLGIGNQDILSDGKLTANMSVAGLLSGALSADVDGVRNIRDMQMNYRNVKFDFSSLASSGSIRADEVGLLSKGGDTYVSYKNLIDIGMMSEDAQKILKQYEGAWLNLQSQSGMTADEQMGYTFTKNLFTKSPKDIAKYFRDAPVLKDMADLGMSGALHLYAVDLDRANIVTLSKKLTLDLSGTGLTDERVKELEANLKSVSFSGVLGFDPKNENDGMLSGSLSQSGTVVATLQASRIGDAISFTLGNPEQKAALNFTSAITGNQTNFTGSVTEAGVDAAKMTGYLLRDADKLKELVINGTAKGVSATLTHTVTADGFVGKLNASIVTLEWTGKKSGDSLSSLKVDGMSPFGTLTADLKDDGTGMIKGPVTVKYGEETLSASIGFQIQKEIFAFLFDMTYQGMPVHFDLMSRAKVTPGIKDVIAPTNVKSFQELINAINATTPTLPEIDQTSSPDSITLPQ